MRTNAQLLSPADLGELLGIPVGTIYQWNYRGVGPKRICIGRHVRYRREDVDIWLAARESYGRAS